jgi:hypothetical protein
VHNGVFSSGVDFVYARHDFQFFNTQRLNELYEKEVKYLVVISQLELYFLIHLTVVPDQTLDFCFISLN